MPTKEPKFEPRIIRSESELREMLKTFLPNSESQARKTMMDAFDLLSARMETEKGLEEIDPEDFGGYIPAPLTMSPSIVSLDRFIERSMGGSRDGLTITWSIHGDTWVFDPYTGALHVKRDS